VQQGSPPDDDVLPDYAELLAQLDAEEAQEQGGDAIPGYDELLAQLDAEERLQDNKDDSDDADNGLPVVSASKLKLKTSITGPDKTHTLALLNEPDTGLLPIDQMLCKLDDDAVAPAGTSTDASLIQCPDSELQLAIVATALPEVDEHEDDKGGWILQRTLNVFRPEAEDSLLRLQCEEDFRETNNSALRQPARQKKIHIAKQKPSESPGPAPMLSGPALMSARLRGELTNKAPATVMRRGDHIEFQELRAATMGLRSSSSNVPSRPLGQLATNKLQAKGPAPLPRGGIEHLPAAPRTVCAQQTDVGEKLVQNGDESETQVSTDVSTGYRDWGGPLARAPFRCWKLQTVFTCVVDVQRTDSWKFRSLAG